MNLDLTSLLGDALKKGGLEKITELTGANTKDAGSIINSALPALMKQLGNNAASKTKSASLDTALNKKKTMGLSKINMEDGAKVLGHVFGSKLSGVTDMISSESGVSGSKVSSVMSALAPLVLSAAGKIKAKGGLDIKDISKLLKKSATGDNILVSLIDADGDGDIKDDLLGHAVKFIKKFIGGKK